MSTDPRPGSLVACDWARSFLRWSSTHSHHTPRLQLASACLTTVGGSTELLYLAELCLGETMYAERGLIQVPPYEFSFAAAPGGRYLMMKSWRDPTRDLWESHLAGEGMSTSDGRGSSVDDLQVSLAYHAKATLLQSFEEVREAILGGLPLNGRTEILLPRGVALVLDYPVKVCNVAYDRARWQVDTGPILLPDSSLSGSRRLESKPCPGWIVWNDPGWVEVAARAPGLQGPSQFSTPERLEARNSLYGLG